MISQVKIPEPFLRHITFISQTLKDAGYSCYLVGGSVRDLYMGKTPGEYDLTTNARPEVVTSLFRKVFETGIQHGTVTVLLDKVGYEVTTFRSETGYSDGRRPDSVEFSTSLDEDLKRRDFTMNALCLDILSGEWIDLHNGRQDIDNKIIRTIGNPVERFSEDGLRPIRGIRFSSTLGFDLDTATEAAFTPTRHITAKVSVERVQVELRKILHSPHPKKGIDLLLNYKYFPLFTNYPILNSLIDENEELWEKLRNVNFLNQASLPWFLFFWFCMDRSEFQPRKNPIRDFKLSNDIEKDVLFFLSGVTFWKKILITSPDSRSDSQTNIELRISDFQILKEFLRPLREYSIKSMWEEEKILLLFLEYLIPYIQSMAKKEESSNIKNPTHNELFEEENFPIRVKKILEENLPLTIKDLAINGNWIQKNFPNAKGKSIGIVLDKSLEAIWEGIASNAEESIRDYLLSHPELFT